MDIRQASNKNKYNIASSIYDFIAFTMSLGQANKLYKEVANILNIPSGGNILELGCGPGSVIPSILEKIDKNTTIVGIDFSDKMIDLANRKKEENKWGNVTFECMDMYEYHPDNKADSIIFCLALTAIPNYEKAIEKALSLLKPNGQLVILDSIPLTGKWYYPIANLYIHLKSLIVGAKPEKGITEYISSRLTIIENKVIVGGVYTLLNAKAKR